MISHTTGLEHGPLRNSRPQDGLRGRWRQQSPPFTRPKSSVSPFNRNLTSKMAIIIPEWSLSSTGINPVALSKSTERIFRRGDPSGSIPTDLKSPLTANWSAVCIDRWLPTMPPKTVKEEFPHEQWPHSRCFRQLCRIRAAVAGALHRARHPAEPGGFYRWLGAL